MKSIIQGDYDRRVTLLALVETVGDGGSAVDTYSVISKVWAKIETQQFSSRLLSIGDKIEYNILHKVSFPYSTAYNAARRITYEFDGETRTFEVQNWINSGQRNRQMVVTCQEVESRTS